MPKQRSESRRGSTVRSPSVVLGHTSRRSRSRTRDRGSRQSRHSSAAHRTDSRGSKRGRSRRSPSRAAMQARSSSSA